jgi:hypothetical protein
MVAIATCRYCDAGVPHEVCRESVVSSPETIPTHEHHYEAELSCDDPSYVVRDCACGHRIRTHKEGGHETILEDGLVQGGSLANAVFVYRPEVNRNGVSWVDRWSV